MTIIYRLLIVFFLHEGRCSNIQSFFVVWVRLKFVCTDLDEMIYVDFMAINLALIFVWTEIKIFFLIRRCD
jgi:hypothetical protein